MPKIVSIFLLTTLLSCYSIDKQNTLVPNEETDDTIVLAEDETVKAKKLKILNIIPDRNERELYVSFDFFQLKGKEKLVEIFEDSYIYEIIRKSGKIDKLITWSIYDGELDKHCSIQYNHSDNFITSSMSVEVERYINYHFFYIHDVKNRKMIQAAYVGRWHQKSKLPLSVIFEVTETDNPEGFSSRYWLFKKNGSKDGCTHSYLSNHFHESANKVQIQKAMKKYSFCKEGIPNFGLVHIEYPEFCYNYCY